MLAACRREVGEGIRKWLDEGNERKDVFVTSKLKITMMEPGDVEAGCDQTLKDLGLEYLVSIVVFGGQAAVKPCVPQLVSHDQDLYLVRMILLRARLHAKVTLVCPSMADDDRRCIGHTE